MHQSTITQIVYAVQKLKLMLLVFNCCRHSLPIPILPIPILRRIHNLSIVRIGSVCKSAFVSSGNNWHRRPSLLVKCWTKSLVLDVIVQIIENRCQSRAATPVVFSQLSPKGMRKHSADVLLLRNVQNLLLLLVHCWPAATLYCIPNI